MTFSAALVPVGSKRLILDNDGHDPKRRRNSVSHEMSHLVLEHEFSRVLLTADGYRAFSPDREDEANWLGGELLIPYAAAERAARLDWSDEQVAEAYDVSVPLARMRMNLSGARKVVANKRAYRTRGYGPFRTATLSKRDPPPAADQRKRSPGIMGGDSEGLSDDRHVRAAEFDAPDARRCHLGLAELGGGHMVVTTGEGRAPARNECIALRCASGTPNWLANLGSLAAVSASVSCSMNRRSRPRCAVVTDLGGPAVAQLVVQPGPREIGAQDRRQRPSAQARPGRV